MKLQEERYPLYHITDHAGLFGILHEDQMIAKPKLGEAVCFSRDPNYNYVLGTEKIFIARIVIDSEKLSHNYKIVPFCSQSPWVKGKRVEAEERVYKTIKNVGRYITDIIPLYNFNECKYDKYYIDAFFKFLKKYPHIKNRLFSNLEDISDISDEICGIYKNGKKVKGFTEETAADTVWYYFDLASKYEDEQEASWEHSHFTAGSPDVLADEIYADDLKGHDLIWTTYREIHIRAQDMSKYDWVKVIDLPLIEEDYHSQFESMLNPDFNGEEDY